MDINKYLEVFDKFSYNNRLYGVVTAHLITGQFLIRNLKFLPSGHRKIDPRISLMLLKESQTGGSSGFDFVASIATPLDLGIANITEITSAGMIGTSKDVYDEDDGTKGQEAVCGIMGDPKYAILYFDEASFFFQKNAPPHQQNLRNIVQVALNPYYSETSRIKKKMAKVEINYHTDKSLYAVSFPPRELDEYVAKTGFLQRFVTVNRPHTLDDRVKNAFKDIDYLGIKEEDTDLQEIINSLKETNNFIKETDEFKVNEDTKPVLKSYTEDMKDVVKDTSEILREDTGTFINAFQRHMYAISLHHATWRESDTVDVQDVKYAYRTVIRPVFMDMVSWLESKTEIRKALKEEQAKEGSIKNMYIELLSSQEPLVDELEGFVSLRSLAEKYAKTNRLTIPSGYRVVGKLENKEEKQYGKSKYVKVL